MFLGALGTSLLGNLLQIKEMKCKILEREVMIAGEVTIRADESTITAGQIFHWYLIL